MFITKPDRTTSTPARGITTACCGVPAHEVICCGDDGRAARVTDGACCAAPAAPGGSRPRCG